MLRKHIPEPKEVGLISKGEGIARVQERNSLGIAVEKYTVSIYLMLRYRQAGGPRVMG